MDQPSRATTPPSLAAFVKAPTQAAFSPCAAVARLGSRYAFHLFPLTGLTTPQVNYHGQEMIVSRSTE